MTKIIPEKILEVYRMARKSRKTFSPLSLFLGKGAGG
jgi:hypothetical protein